MRIILFSAMIILVVVYAGDVVLRTAADMKRLFHASHPDLSVTVEDLRNECRNWTVWSGSEFAPSAECANSIRRQIENIETRGVLAWRMTSNEEFLICAARLKALSDRELANWFENDVAPHAYGAGDVLPAELISFVVLDEENRCTG